MSELSKQVERLEVELKLAQAELRSKKTEVAILQREVANLGEVTRRQALDPIIREYAAFKSLAANQIRDLERQAIVHLRDIMMLTNTIKLTRETCSASEVITIVKNGVSKRFMPVSE